MTASRGSSAESAEALAFERKRSVPPSPAADPPALLRPTGYDLREYRGKMVRRGPSGGRRVALTFDDGPSVNTEKVLEVLREHRAKATFFFVGGRILGKEAVALDVVRQGSEVANHTWSHVELKGLSEAQVEKTIRLTQEEIVGATGVQNEFVRPRGGACDDTALEVVRRMGLVMVGWDASGHDTFKEDKTVEQIEALTVREAGAGSIVLLHEMNPSTVRALPAILDRLEAEGYQLVTLADLLRPG